MENANAGAAHFMFNTLRRGCTKYHRQVAHALSGRCRKAMASLLLNGTWINISAMTRSGISDPSVKRPLPEKNPNHASWWLTILEAEGGGRHQTVSSCRAHEFSGAESNNFAVAVMFDTVRGAGCPGWHQEAICRFCTTFTTLHASVSTICAAVVLT